MSDEGAKDVATARVADARCLSDEAAFFHESMERLAGGLGVTFEGVSRDWIAGTDPICGPAAGPQILTADGWKPMTRADSASTTDREAKQK